jgi:hypothetical protein
MRNVGGGWSGAYIPLRLALALLLFYGSENEDSPSFFVTVGEAKAFVERYISRGCLDPGTSRDAATLLHTISLTALEPREAPPIARRYRG